MAMLEAMLLSAGFGKRLRPLTDTIPKPLVSLEGKPLIERNLELLARGGIKRVFINLHYLGEQIETFVGDGARWGLEVEYSHEAVLLDTGGGIKNIESRLTGEHLLTINSDVLIDSEFPIREFISSHLEDADCPLSTMVLRHDPLQDSFGTIGLDERGQVLRFLKSYRPPGESESARIKENVMFAGIQILRSEVFSLMPPAGSIFSITRDTLSQAVQAGALIKGYIFDGFWSDIGTPDRLEAASKFLRLKVAQRK